jgi:hypothetical protein
MHFQGRCKAYKAVGNLIKSKGGRGSIVAGLNRVNLYIKTCPNSLFRRKGRKVRINCEIFISNVSREVKD